MAKQDIIDCAQGIAEYLTTIKDYQTGEELVLAEQADIEEWVTKFVSAMEKNNIDLGSWDHQDQLGYGQIFSWNTSKFDDAREVV